MLPTLCHTLCTDQVIGCDDVSCTWLGGACSAEHVGKKKMDGSEVSVVAGSWNWRSAMNMVGCRRVFLSSTCLAIGDQVVWHRRRKHVARSPDKLILKLMKAQRCKFKCTTPVRRLLRQHGAWRAFELRGQLAYQRQDSQSGHSLMARFPQPEHAWRSGKEGAISDKRYHRDGALCCTWCSLCQVMF